MYKTVEVTAHWAHPGYASSLDWRSFVAVVVVSVGSVELRSPRFDVAAVQLVVALLVVAV